MYVKHLDGRFAGQEQEIDNGAALDLIRIGRAERVTYHDPAPEAPLVIASGVDDAELQSVANRKKRTR